MKDPESLQNSDQHLKTLVHGDLWHNNIYFNCNQLIFGGWQMCHLGSVATDVCFFLCSSTTTSFRKNHWDDIIKYYFRELTTNLKDLLGDFPKIKLPIFEEFLLDVKASIPLRDN